MSDTGVSDVAIVLLLPPRMCLTFKLISLYFNLHSHFSIPYHA